MSHPSPTCINRSQDLQQHAMEITCLIMTTCLFFLRTFSWSTPYKRLLHLNISFNLWKWSLISRGTKLLRYYFSLKWTEKVLLQPSNPPSHTVASQMSTRTQANFRQIRPGLVLELIKHRCEDVGCHVKALLKLLREGLRTLSLLLLLTYLMSCGSWEVTALLWV